MRCRRELSLPLAALLVLSAFTTARGGEKTKQKRIVYQEADDPIASEKNLALKASVKASSTREGRNPNGAVDGKAGGWPNIFSQEWVSNGQKKGAQLRLTWKKPQLVDRVWLFDRPSRFDRVTAGRITFSDGSTAETGTLPNSARNGLEITFRPRKITWLEFRVTDCRAGGAGIGLAEIAVFHGNPGAQYYDPRKKTPAAAQQDDYFDFLVRRLTAERKLPGKLADWEKRRAGLRKKLLRGIGLDPLPEKTPLDLRFVGGPIELERCTFRRVVFESRPGNYVAAHLYLPKNVEFPVPAVLHVPSSSLRDSHMQITRCLTFASSGFVTLSMPILERGKPGSGLGGRGDLGPYLRKKFHWYSTGYHPLGVEVWDNIRAVDYLLTLKDPKTGKPLVKADKIGLSGMSAGSSRTLWGAAADPRIAVAIPICGWNTIKGVRSVAKRGVHAAWFNNYAGITCGELFGLIAPRPLLVLTGKRDAYYTAEGADELGRAVKKIYALYGRPENFEHKALDQGHWYEGPMCGLEDAWLNRWLRKAEAPMVRVRRRPKALLDKKNLLCFTDSDQEGWRLLGKPLKAVNIEKQFTPPTPKWEVKGREDFRRFRARLSKALREEVLRYAFRPLPAELKGEGGQDREGWREERVTLTIEGVHALRAVFHYKPGGKRKTVVLLADVPLKELESPAARSVVAGANLLCLEPTGIGATERYMYRYSGLCFSPMVGHTLSSLRVNDALAAVREISRHRGVDPKRVYLWGRGHMAVPALYAAAVEEKVAGVVLEDAPDTHMAEAPGLALLFILRHADIPHSAGLIFPRPVVLAGNKTPGYKWTKKLYRTLGKPERFAEAGADVGAAVGKLP